MYPRITELYQGRRVPCTLLGHSLFPVPPRTSGWAITVVPSDRSCLCVLLQGTFLKTKKLALQRLLGGKVYFMECFSVLSETMGGRKIYQFWRKTGRENRVFFPPVPWKYVVLVIEKGMCCWQGHGRRAAEDPMRESVQPLESQGQVHQGGVWAG